MSLYVGTSGWAYPEWRPDFYPKEVPRKRWLAHYATKLSACEINATFYKLHDRSVIEGWAREVPQGFRFAIKAHRVLTHGKSIGPDERRAQRLTDFLNEASGLGARRGPVLFQLPAYRKVDVGGLKALLERLPKDWRFAFEFRDDSWKVLPVIDAIVESGGTICLSNTDGVAPAALPPGAFAYVRLRAERYPTRKRAGWRKRLEGDAAERDVYVFTKHEGGPPADPFAGVGLGTWLQRYARSDGMSPVVDEVELEPHRSHLGPLHAPPVGQLGDE